jgi:hypothetical protein
MEQLGKRGSVLPNRRNLNPAGFCSGRYKTALVSFPSELDKSSKVKDTGDGSRERGILTHY